MRLIKGKKSIKQKERWNIREKTLPLLFEKNNKVKKRFVTLYAERKRKRKEKKKGEKSRGKTECLKKIPRTLGKKLNGEKAICYLP